MEMLPTSTRKLLNQKLFGKMKTEILSKILKKEPKKKEKIQKVTNI